jgi:hypothetical protein
LIIGNAEDEHAAAVADAIRATSIEPMLVDVARLENMSYSLRGDRLEVWRDGSHEQVTLGGSTRGWIRRLAPPHWRRGVTLGTEEAAVRGAWTALLTVIAGAADVLWLTPLERLMLRENKLLQQTIATRLGIDVPATAVVSDRTQIPTEWGTPIVVKPLGAGNYSDESGAERIVWAQELDRDSPLLGLLAAAPFLLQRRLDAERHLRVVTVRDHSWACELTGERPLDWRRDEEAHHSFVAVAEPAVQQNAVRLADALGVGYSSQDWIVADDGVPHFVDLNPAGQWLFLPDDVGTEITQAIASWLTR